MGISRESQVVSGSKATSISFLGYTGANSGYEDPDKEEYLNFRYQPEWPIEVEQPPELVIKGPPDNLCTVFIWDSSEESPILSDIESDIADLLLGLKKMQPLQRPKELLQMANKVASEIAQPKTPEDIEEWAEKLSDDLSKMTD